MRPSREDLRGLGLVEALVATAIAAALIGGLLAVVGTSSAATARIEAQREGQALARQLLFDPDPEDGRGVAGTLAWTRHVHPSPYDFDRRAADGYRLLRITVEVSGAGLGAGLTVATERILR